MLLHDYLQLPHLCSYSKYKTKSFLKAGTTYVQAPIYYYERVNQVYSMASWSSSWDICFEEDFGGFCLSI